MLFRAVLLLSVLVVASLPVAAAEIRIATWNVHEGFSVEGIEKRANELRQFAKAVRPDVLLVQEVTSLEVLTAVRDCMGLGEYEVVCSDFAPSDEPDFTALEVGIISRIPLSQVIEYDPSPDFVPGKNSPPELLLEPQLKLGIRKPEGDIRGFLWARLDSIKTSVVVVHLKSSRGIDGPADYANAQKREFVAAAIATGVIEDRAYWPDFHCFVGGDFNVGHSDKKKNGHDLFRDDATDAYDDTHAMFAEGIVGGLKMRNLIGKIQEPTFPALPSSPIDNIYAIGPRAAAFKSGVVERDTFGSDHRPVWVAVDLPVANDYHVPTLAAGHQAPEPRASLPAPKSGEIISAADALNHADQDCTVEFVVRGGNLLDGRGLCFLNSSADFREKDNFTAVIRDSALKELAARGVPNPSTAYRGKQVQVAGRITLRDGKAQIEVRSADQIKLVGG
ncbi:MAG TPA: endonuclease/exonuclease/phosphatase family protein [Pirellulales bacterium]|nr:endonuclease/exonuclease/phosphatase family protein [Pirellulales bacterium]